MSDNPITRKELYLAKLSGQDVEVPEPITREEKYLYAAIMSGGGTGGATPDWNAAEGEQGHILNRTHYDEWVEIIPEQVGVYQEGVTAVAPADETTPLIVGETYRVTINGVSYESVAKSYLHTGSEPAVTVVYLGDYMGMSGFGESTGEPYVAMWVEQEPPMNVAYIAPHTEAATIGLYHLAAVPIPIRYMPEPCVVSLNKDDFTEESTTIGGNRYTWANLEDKDYDVSGLARAWVEKRPITIEIYFEDNGVRSVVSRLTPTSFNPLALLVDPSQYLDNPDVLNGRTWWRITAMGCIANGIDANFIDIELGYVNF